MSRRSKPDLAIYWSRRERALVYDGPSTTGGMLAYILERLTLGEMHGRECGVECHRNGITARVRAGQPPDPSDKRTLAQELAERGYDLSTLRFSIRKKTAP